MASVEELKAVLKDTLENRGVLSQIRARVRSEVFSALDEQRNLKPTLSNENLLINELIREYMDFNSYKYSCSVLTAEANQPKERIDRNFLMQELNIEDDCRSESIPLLYRVVSYFLKGENIRHPNKIEQRNQIDIVSTEEPSTQDDDEKRRRNDLIVYANH